MSSLSSCWIIIEAFIESDNLAYTPNKFNLINLFEEIVTKSVTRICSKHNQLVRSKELSAYIKTGDNEEEEVDDGIDLDAIIKEDKIFK